MGMMKGSLVNEICIFLLKIMIDFTRVQLDNTKRSCHCPLKAKDISMAAIWQYFKRGCITCCFACVIGCQVRNTRSPLLQYRCITNSSDEVIFRHGTRHQCESRCLSMESCRYINMNPSNDSCELGFGRCAYLVSSVGYMAKHLQQ